MKTFSIYLHHPFTMLVAGPSGSGKTFWIRKLLERKAECINPPPERVLYFYTEYQKIFNEMNNNE